MRRSRFVTALLAATLAFGLGACGGSDSGGSDRPDVNVDDIPTAPEDGQFHMGIEPWIGYGAWWIADEKQLFADHDLDVKVTNFNTDADINAALASGELDGANIATHTAMKMIESGLPITAVLLEDVSEDADAIISTTELTSAADLEGKEVAYEEGTTSEILLSYALAQEGLSLDDIKKVPMGAADVGAALLAGRVDVGVTYEPYITEIMKNDKYHLLYTAGEKPGLISDVLVIRNEVIEQRPGQVLALLGAWDDASTFLRENPEEGRTIIAENVGADPADLQTAFDGVVIYTLGEAKELMLGDFASSTVPAVSDAAIQAKMITEPVDAEAFMDNTFIEAATK